MFKNINNRLKRASSKKLVVWSAFVVAMIAAAGLGIATKQYSSAAMVRDCDNNAIMRCGADDIKEFVADARANNGRTQAVQGDIQGIYNHYGLSTSEYTRFEQTAVQGTVYKDGRVVVNGQTVATGANSLGREKFNSARKAVAINGKTYYYSATKDSFQNDSLPAMIMFNDKGEVEFIALNACGNPVWGTKVTPEYSCKSLNQKSLGNNTYEYTTTVGAMKNATVNKVVYNFGDGSAPVTKTNPNEAVKHTFTKSSTVTVTVYFNLPGKNVVAATIVANCKKDVKVTPPPAPFYACTLLQAVALNDKKTQFRFIVKTSQGNGATLKNVDFTLDGTNTTTGVTTKDGQGNIYKDYTFQADGKEHKVVAKVNFNVASAVQSKTCEAKITPEKAPVCPLPGKEMFPPNAPECAEDKENCPVPGKEHLPKDSPECKEDETPPATPPELPKTGMGGIAGAAVAVSAIGGVAHHVIANRRRN
jgi:hypothetical protein